jgi:hypothetical protein
MMSKKPEIEICMHCGKVITRQRTPDGHPKFAWKAGEPNAAVGWYCPQAGGDCWHHPKCNGKVGE